MTITPDRSIAFTAVFNFRDLGGLPAGGGAVVRPGTVYRSDTLSRLIEADRDSFGALGVRTVIDLRRPSEVAAYGRVPEWTGVVWRHNHLDHPLWDHSTYTAETGVARWLADRYLELAHFGRGDIARVVGMLTDADNGPTVVHCLAGKDRTGLIVAMTLELLGVGDDEIAQDYALTGLSEAAFTRWFLQTHPEQAQQPTPIVYQQTPAEAMLITLHELRGRYGSVREYLVAAGLHPDRIAMLRDRLLQR
ncbi:protein-tyrosine-phosphatase [Catellatospora sp. TT07R-123]|uniref:tyrosine-protein phosphatase n=1 Tax=Catellatospora sp. TT07R-123 TaxID=2733863 RepID=UPI001B01C39D|nr:tyrosine-protein phosphatase [Catellatospora sp. TT07R-123]GHJ45114.1 protein-tyrosine-phosphatase [Catellatospora sp. TT07R-123]